MTVNYVKTIDEVTDMIRQHELEEKVKFYIYKQDGEFTNLTQPPAGENMWKGKSVIIDKLNFLCMYGGRKLYDCMHGPERHQPQKDKEKKARKEKQKSDHSAVVKTKTSFQPTRKAGCQAQIVIRKLFRFTKFKLTRGSRWERGQMSNQLKVDPYPTYETVFEVTIPDISQHQNHLLNNAAAEMVAPVDDVIKKKIHRLVMDQGVYTLPSMRTHLRDYVKTNYPEVSELNTRFHPDDRTIANHIQLALSETMYSRSDQENLELTISKEWSGPDEQKFLFQKSTSESPFMFISQTPHQKRMLQRYGNEICFMDATHRTTKYALFLFFVVVKTNVDYQVVASFILEHETQEQIALALNHLKTWNPSWNPKFFMTDYSHAEMSALEECFAGVRVLLCDFHREQAWLRNFRKKEMNLDDTEMGAVLSMMRKIAQAANVDDHVEAIQMLEGHSLWLSKKHRKLREYISNVWLDKSIVKKWASCYRRGRVIVANTNNGVERLNGVFKKSYLMNRTSNTLSMTVRILVEQFYPYLMKKYNTDNVSISALHKPYDPSLPQVLKERPQEMIKYYMEALHRSLTIHAHQTTKISDVQFKVGHSNHKVDMSLPSCECFSWLNSSYPCKHMLAVVRHHQIDLPAHYLSQPWFCIDEHVIVPTSQVEPERCDTQCADANGSDFLQLLPDSDVSQPLVDSLADVAVSGTTTQPELPSRKSAKSVASMCREVLESLRSLTYLIADPQKLQSLHDTLKSVLLQCRGSTKKEDELPVHKIQQQSSEHRHKTRPMNLKRKLSVCQSNSNRLVKRAKICGVEKKQELRRSSLTVNKLRLRKGRNKYAGRVGMKAEGMRAVIDVSKHIMCPEVKPHSSSSQMTPSSEEMVDLTMVPDSPVKGLREEFVGTKRWLSTKELNMALLSLKNQWPDVRTQPVEYIQRPQHFNAAVECNFGQYVQILHMESAGHWIAVSNISGNGKIRVFDSLNLPIPHRIHRAIASLEKSPSSSMQLIMEPVQLQQGCDDCGFFAMAFLVELLLGGKPARSAFDQSKMREHFVKCLSAGRWSKFPTTEEAVRRGIRSTKTLKLYCNCRMPYCDTDIKRPGLEMIQCTYCHEWFHRQCIILTPIDIDPFTQKVDESYYCQKCKDNGKYGF